MEMSGSVEGDFQKLLPLLGASSSVTLDHDLRGRLPLSAVAQTSHRSPATQKLPWPRIEVIQSTEMREVKSWLCRTVSSVGDLADVSNTARVSATLAVDLSQTDTCPSSVLSRYNLVGANGKQYMIQQNWDITTGGCRATSAVSYTTPAPTAAGTPAPSTPDAPKYVPFVIS